MSSEVIYSKRHDWDETMESLEWVELYLVPVVQLNIALR